MTTFQHIAAATTEAAAEEILSVERQALTDAVALCLRARRLLFAEFGLACLGQHSTGYDWLDRIERRIWQRYEGQS